MDNHLKVLEEQIDRCARKNKNHKWIERYEVTRTEKSEQIKCFRNDVEYDQQGLHL